MVVTDCLDCREHGAAPLWDTHRAPVRPAQRKRLQFPGSLRSRPLTQPEYDGLLDSVGRDHLSRASLGSALLRPMAEVVRILAAMIGSETVNHMAPAHRASHQPTKRSFVAIPLAIFPATRGALKNAAHTIKPAPFDDRRLLAGIDLAVMPDLAHIKDVGQKPQQRRAIEVLAYMLLPVAGSPALELPASPANLL